MKLIRVEHTLGTMRVYLVDRFVNDNLDSKLKWDEIAASIGLDPFTFGRGFKLATGMTPHQYLRP